MILIQGINLLSSFLFLIFTFYFIQSTFYWTRLIRENTFDLNKIRRFIYSPFEVYSYVLKSKKSITALFLDLAIFLCVLIVDYFLYFDLLKLLSAVLIKRYPHLVLFSFLLAIIYLNLLSPITVFCVHFIIKRLVVWLQNTIQYFSYTARVRVKLAREILILKITTILKARKKAKVYN
jgi:hypothetical protein